MDVSFMSSRIQAISSRIPVTCSGSMTLFFHSGLLTDMDSLQTKCRFLTSGHCITFKRTGNTRFRLISNQPSLIKVLGRKCGLLLLKQHCQGLQQPAFDFWSRNISIQRSSLQLPCSWSIMENSMICSRLELVCYVSVATMR